MGTLQWRWLDDDGREHTHRIPNSYYVPDGGHRLLSPQHWAQTCPKEQRHADTTADGVRLHWGPAGKYRLTLALNESTNVADIPMAAGFRGAVAFLAKANMDIVMEDNAVLVNDLLPPAPTCLSAIDNDETWCQLHPVLGDLCAMDATVRP